MSALEREIAKYKEDFEHECNKHFNDMVSRIKLDFPITYENELSKPEIINHQKELHQIALNAPKYNFDFDYLMNKCGSNYIH